jgi:sulfoxide reductase catalytic subunit YedY
MLIRKPDDIPSSEITPESVYVNRRGFIGAAAAAIATVAAPASLVACAAEAEGAQDKANSYEEITQYNNFYEFGTDKEDPARLAPRLLKTRPWTVSIEGLCRKPGRYPHRHPHPRQPRAGPHLPPALRGGMVDGDPLAGDTAARRARQRRAPPRARFVELTTLHDPRQMPGQQRGCWSGRT